MAGWGTWGSSISDSFGVSGTGDGDRLRTGYLEVRAGRWAASSLEELAFSWFFTESLSSIATAASASVLFLEAAASASSRSFLRLAASAASFDEPPSKPPLYFGVSAVMLASRSDGTLPQGISQKKSVAAALVGIDSGGSVM